MNRNQQEELDWNGQEVSRLVDRLDRYPVGLPDSPEIRQFLSIFLTKEEIILAASFPLTEVTALELGEKLSWPVEKVEKLLEGLAQKGTVMDFRPRKGEVFWMLTPSVVGFVEFSLMKLHPAYPMPKLASLIERYEDEHLWKEVFGSKTPISRALIDFDVPIDRKVMSLVELEKVIKQAGGGAVQTCFCRHKKSLLGEDCQKAPFKETCFSLGNSASSFVVRRGFARPVTAEEMVAMIRELDKHGLIHVTDNVRDKPTFICNCCGCCCGLLAGIKIKKITHAVAPTPYILQLDREKCIGCGACTKQCQIEALTLSDDKKMVIDKEQCLGCGSCIKFCKQQALSLISRKNIPPIPKNNKNKFLKVAWEKKRFFPLFWANFKRSFRR